MGYPALKHFSIGTEARIAGISCLHSQQNLGPNFKCDYFVWMMKNDTKR